MSLFFLFFFRRDVFYYYYILFGKGEGALDGHNSETWGWRFSRTQSFRHCPTRPSFPTWEDRLRCIDTTCWWNEHFCFLQKCKKMGGDCGWRYTHIAKTKKKRLFFCYSPALCFSFPVKKNKHPQHGQHRKNKNTISLVWLHLLTPRHLQAPVNPSNIFLKCYST